MYITKVIKLRYQNTITIRFHISHKKIRSNTRINTLFQLTTTRLRYHITFTIAAVIQATEKRVFWHKWVKNEVSDFANYTVLLSLLLNGNLWLRSIRCFTFTTIKWRSLTTLTTFFTSPLLKWNIWLLPLHCFSFLTTLATLFCSLLLKWNIWLRSLRWFYFHCY